MQGTSCSAAFDKWLRGRHLCRKVMNGGLELHLRWLNPPSFALCLSFLHAEGHESRVRTALRRLYTPSFVLHLSFLLGLYFVRGVWMRCVILVLPSRGTSCSGSKLYCPCLTNGCGEAPMQEGHEGSVPATPAQAEPSFLCPPFELPAFTWLGSVWMVQLWGFGNILAAYPCRHMCRKVMSGGFKPHLRSLNPSSFALCLSFLIHLVRGV
ncbi:hypothetical protein JTE90_020718 [Oedothorax gibbosus]|uniref:Uncharacterized protein n=1 Tax=Oedothorax gibbosus TaxID=931172 RepID=A0AAV6V695_9ARAC|nr:hypothetical protein JTE90_020718 [Oedothorax gibbosus]